jgi:hypothetical protein
MIKKEVKPIVKEAPKIVPAAPQKPQNVNKEAPISNVSMKPLATKKCPRCGTMNEPNKERCLKCNFPLVAEKAPMKMEPIAPAAPQKPQNVKIKPRC